MCSFQETIFQIINREKKNIEIILNAGFQVMMQNVQTQIEHNVCYNRNNSESDKSNGMAQIKWADFWNEESVCSAVDLQLVAISCLL